jgi:hypothetical protein
MPKGRMIKIISKLEIQYHYTIYSKYEQESNTNDIN